MINLKQLCVDVVRHFYMLPKDEPTSPGKDTRPSTALTEKESKPIASSQKEFTPSFKTPPSREANKADSETFEAVTRQFNCEEEL